MIHIGLDDAEKAAIIDRYAKKHGLSRVYVFAPERFAPTFAPTRMADPASECDGRPGLFVEWRDIIEYRYYYPLIQGVERNTIVVVNECLRTKNRHDLAYNCLRNIINRTPHVLVFQYLPFIDSAADFMTLFDFVTQSRWKREPFDVDLVRREASIHVRPRIPGIESIPVPTPPSVRKAYEKKRAELFEEVRGDPEKDPHVIPRNLILVSGRCKLGHIDAGEFYAGRSARNLPNVETWRGLSSPGERIAIEVPHNFIDLADALTVTRQSRLRVMVADTKADRWYFDRLTKWAEDASHVANALHG